ncbi:MAG TPA: PilZ domain-containing protein [Anaeromyxobacteraceae bacterium]|nr:PilZ domain-containing protein [Anaeromyxobacteraceae bacterium]
MSGYIVNPRRAPRAPSRCAALVEAPAASWRTETEDIGPHGCQLVSPSPVGRGIVVQLTVACDRVPGELRVAGRVAWVSSQPPWRVGVAFAEAARPAASAWFERLVAASPGLGAFRRVPDRLSVDAMIFLGPPPRLVVDFTADEVQVLSHVAAGITVADLRSRLQAAWPAAQRALFSLMARQAVTISRAAASHPAAWRRVLAEYGASFVVEKPAPRAAPPAAATPLPVPINSARAEAAVQRAVEVSGALPIVAPSERAGVRGPATPQAASAEVTLPPLPPLSAPPPGVATAGTGWRGVARSRSREAQEAFDLGRLELDAGRTSSALAHLRRALQLSPGDADVAAELGRALQRGG